MRDLLRRQVVHDLNPFRIHAASGDQGCLVKTRHTNRTIAQGSPVRPTTATALPMSCGSAPDHPLPKHHIRNARALDARSGSAILGPNGGPG